jgi:filamentous hemagglutinin
MRILWLATVAASGLAGWTFYLRPLDAAQLPVPCVANSCGTGVSGFVTSGAASAAQAGNTLTIKQSTPQVILNWSSFNVSADGIVQFVQPSATSIALNRIFQQSPSSIFGQVTANGQIYLINPNGILFGPTAQINAAGLIASSLGISDATFAAGLLANSVLGNGNAALQSDGRPYVEDSQGNPVLGPDGLPIPVQVVVESGAQISTPGGRLLLAAPTVLNGGTLSAPEGQVILAAGQKVYLQASSDPSLRGLIVEVDQGGTAWNQLTGAISADQGNVSMIGLAVNQDGRISATTSVSANGSVRLEAADTVSISGTNQITLSATHGGTLEMGPQSSIDISPDLNSTATATAADVQLQSQIDLSGEQVLFEGGSITAPDGILRVVAAADPGSGVVTDGNSDARIRIHSGTTIDLAGSTAELPMAANLVAIQLRANELADDPTQRNGLLRGQTVYVDQRVGTKIIGASALQAALAAVPESIAQRTEQGGQAIFESEGDIVLEQGATINVSGGQTQYAGGVMQTTQLMGANGQLYDIGTANPLLTYVGVVNPTFTQSYSKWGVQTVQPTPGLSHYEDGYVQGASAGSIQFAAPNMVLEGTLLGQAVNGPYQRSGSGVAQGGTLILGIPLGLASSVQTDFLTPAIVFTAASVPTSVADDTALLPQTLLLPVDYISAGGFQNTKIYGDSTVTVPTGVPLNLGPGGSLLIEAPRIDILSDISAPGGSVQLQSLDTIGLSDASVGRPGIIVGDDVSLDVRGQWVNDSPDVSSAEGVGPTLQNGGQISLSLGAEGSELVLGDNVALEASGGVWVSSTNKLTGGNGGSISLLAVPLQSAVQIGSNVQLDAFGVDGAAGGSFALSAPRLLISSSPPGGGWSGAQGIDDLTAPGGVLDINAALFNSYGFSSVTLVGTGAVVPGAVSDDILTVAAGTQIQALAQTLSLNPNYLMLASGGDVSGFSHLVTLPETDRTPVNISLGVLPQTNDSSLLDVGMLDVQTGATIASDPGASISLNSLGGIFVDGTLRAPGGDITLQIQTPTQTPDPGFRPDLSIELGPDAVLDVSGTAVMTPNQLGLKLGTVLAGGTIDLFADRGDVLAEPGSVINFAGASAALDVETGMGTGIYLPYTVASAGGALQIRSGESVSLLGALQAAAGVGDYGNLAGGSLELDLTRAQGWFSGPASTQVPQFSTSPLLIDLVSDSGGVPANTAGSDEAVLGVTQLMASGIDSLHLVAGNQIEFSGSVPLKLTLQAIFDAPSISVDPGVSASVAANFVELGNSQLPGNPGTPAAGTGTLAIQAQQIDLLGSIVLPGVDQLSLTSEGDLQMLGVVNAQSQLQGSLTLSGDVTIDASRIYPSTLTEYSITALGSGNSVKIGQTAPAAGVPLSAGGELSISADEIDSAGTLLAPFGSINLDAGTALNLQPGSMTSVSGAGQIIPFGQTELGGLEWLYAAAGFSAPLTITGIPQRQIQLQAPSVSIAAGATVDLRGGGDLYAFEWVPGSGGTTDALANGSVPGLYAIIPGLQSAYAPYDAEATPGSGLQPGASIYISAGAGIPAGTYALLPARYALLPGAYLVQVQPGYSNLAPGQVAFLPDGTPVVAGYATFGNTGLHSSGFEAIAVWPGSYGQQLAQYQNSLGSTYFAAAAASAGLPPPPSTTDAGQLSIAVAASLNIEGTVLGNAPGSAGKSSDIDISAAQLEVTGSGDTVPVGVVGLSASEINSWQAGQIVLGGQASADGSTVAVQAQSVTIGTGAQVSAGQVILVASQSIDLQSGSSVLSSSATAGGSAPATLPATASVTLTGTDAAGAALLAVSDYSLPVVQRGSSGAAPATITLESGSTIGSLGAIAIDGAGTVTLTGTIKGSGATWSLAGGSIGFVGTVTSTDALQINSTVLAEMQSAADLRLSSPGAIDLEVPVQLGAQSDGAPTMASITMIAPSLNNLTVEGTSTFTAETITVEGAGSSATAPPVAGSGSINIAAQNFNVGPGYIQIGGVSQTNVTATNAVTGQGVGGLQVAGNLTISAPMITAGTATQTQIGAPGGTLQINGVTGTAATVPASGDLGGSIAFNANDIQQTGTVDALSGIVSMQATQDIDLSAGAVIDASGPLVAILDQNVGAEGGRIELSAGGNLNLAAGSALNVSAAGGAPAGQIQLSASGNAVIGGSLDGQATGGAAGGQFTIDAGALSQGLGPLSAQLQTGGFNQLIDIRSRSGNLDLTSGSELIARQVVLTADTGSIEIGGTISAPAQGQRGDIELFGGDGVLLDPSAQLHADTAAGAGIGGDIELGTGSTGTITISAGSVVTATGAVTDGTLLLRAPPSAAGSDVAVNLASSDLSQLGTIIVEPIFTATVGADPTVADWSAAEAPIAAFMSSASANINDRLNPGGTLPLVIRPALDVLTGGSLTIDNAPDFADWQFNGQPVDLTVRAAGSITVATTLSDGYTSTPTLIPNYYSASIRLVAGADQASPDPLEIIAGSNADLTIAAGSVVQTTTGDLDLVASRDVIFAGPGAAAYTAGLPGAPAVAVPDSTSIFNFPTSGGNLLVDAGRDVVGSPVQQSVTAWQIREGGSVQNEPVQWGVDLAQFGWNLATLGGGDVTVTAGGNITDLSVAAADSYAAGANPDGSAHHFLSGGLEVAAGGDIGSGQFFAADGSATLSAGGAFTAVLPSIRGNSLVGSLIAMGDSKVSVEARLGVDIATVVNPTVMTQLASSQQLESAYFTYTGNSALSVQSTAGNVNFNSGGGALITLLGLDVASGYGGSQGQVYPATLEVRALSGDLTPPNGVTLFASDDGQLQLIAAQDIIGNGGVLKMSDAFESDLPTVQSPGSGASPGVITLAPFASGRHVDDPVPALVVAGRDIDNLALYVPKATQIEAGRDISNLVFAGQNLNPTDVTLISAGRDFVDTFGDSSGSVSVGGPGQLKVLAGRDVNLGFSLGITTVGNIVNPNLPTATGANLTIMAGLGQAPDYADFLQEIVVPSSTDQNQLIAYIESLSGQSGLSFTQALTQFKALAADQQQVLLNQIFFDELSLSGLEANGTTGVGFARGYAAIDALFPNSRTAAATGPSPYSGDLDLTFSRIYTLSGGTISLLAPGGMVNVGLANPPAGLGASKPPSSLGIVAQGTGDVDIYSKGDILVNQSRIFTLGGGNILIWSDEGSIDAGRGAKSSVSAPPPQVLVDAEGDITIDFGGAVAGSGIRTIQVDANVPPGNVDLVAPLGTVNAGDAGIGAAGNLNIAAEHVIGLDNIQVGGSATGVPPQVSDIGVSLSGVSNVASSASSSATAATGEAAGRQTGEPLAQAALGWLDVFVTGLGEEDCRPDDMECLRRQKLN